MKFFQPTKKFCDWFVELAAGRPIIEVGCGEGHVGRALRKRGAKVIQIDVRPQRLTILGMDATKFKYLPNCIVLICRPCHSNWVERTVEAAAPQADLIVYVGLEQNFEYDLGEFVDSFKKVAVNAGAEHESVWQMKPLHAVRAEPEPVPVTGRPLKIGIVVDFMGCGDASPEDERRELREKFTELLQAHPLEFYDEHGLNIRPCTDILLYDFGGILPGCDDLLLSNARHLVAWCRENPNSLAIVVSSFTYRHQIQYELEEEGLDLPNVINWEETPEIPAWFLEGKR